MSTERTFPPTSDPQLLESRLVDIVNRLCEHLGEEELSARTVTLKVKTATFQVRTRAVTLPR